MFDQATKHNYQITSTNLCLDKPPNTGLRGPPTFLCLTTGPNTNVDRLFGGPFQTKLKFRVFGPTTKHDWRSGTSQSSFAFGPDIKHIKKRPICQFGYHFSCLATCKNTKNFLGILDFQKCVWVRGQTLRESCPDLQVCLMAWPNTKKRFRGKFVARKK